MILTYCNHCGTFVRTENAVEPDGKILCPDCASGALRTPRRCKDSDRIPSPFRMAFRAQTAKERAALK